MIITIDFWDALILSIIAISVALLAVGYVVLCVIASISDKISKKKDKKK